MPKRKGNPVKLSTLQRREENYCFGGTHHGTYAENAASSSKITKSRKEKHVSLNKLTSVELDTTARLGISGKHIEKCPIKGLDELFLDQDFFVPIKRNLEVDQFYHMGDIKLKIQEHCIDIGESLPGGRSQFRLYVSRIPSRGMVYFEWFQNEETCNNIQAKYCTYDADRMINYETAREFVYGLRGYDPTTREMTISAYLLKFDDQPIAEMYKRKKSNTIHKAMEFFYDIAPPVKNCEILSKCTNEVDDLYTVIKTYHESKDYSTHIDVQHPHLQVQLRPYQRAAVQWMLHREAQLHAPPKDELHPLYKKIITKCGQVLYYNIDHGFFIYNKPIPEPPTPGGILADEMGLGKTVEVLSCMLANPRLDLHQEIEEDIEMKDSLAVAGQDVEDYGEGTSGSKSWSPIENTTTFTEVAKPVAIPSKTPDISLTEDSMAPIKCIKNAIEVKEEILEESPVFNRTSEITIEKSEEKTSEIKTEKSEENRRKSKRICRVRFAEPSVITYDDYVIDDSDSDASWHEGLRFGEHKKEKKSKSVLVKKPVKHLKQAARKPKSKKAVSLDHISDTIEAVISKCCYNIERNEASLDPATICDKKQAAKEAKKEASLVRKAMYIARKQAAKEMYELALSEYSATKVLYDVQRKKHCGGFFNCKVEKKSLFECACGATVAGSSKELVKCLDCGMLQHAECMHFNKAVHKEYICPHCWQLKKPFPSRATLIVSPSSISEQWMSEIQKLVSKRGIKAEFYKGVHGIGFIQPRSLADNDIVITTYETLCKELDYVDLPHTNSPEGRRFRNAKRYMALPSPLPCVQWWRVCLDEAQMVECTTTKTAEMALRLQAVHRWCVTGTPIQHSIADLFGLIMFLGVDPYSRKQWWTQLVQNPHRWGQPETLYKIVSPLMWRTAKADVLDQIGIPQQTEHIHWINFSPVEEHFYRSQHVTCANTVLNRISQLPDLDEKLHMLHRGQWFGLTIPLLSLRQACCHPQAVKGQFVSLNKTTLTMEELLKSLIKKAKLECEESFRQVIAALNGLAGIHVIQEAWVTAVERYREVLMLMEQNKDTIQSDRLQRIHTLHNLAELLEIHSNNVNIPPTLRDSSLRDEARQLEISYLDKYIASLTSAKQAVEPLTQTVTGLQQQLVLPEAWWSLTLGHASAEKEQHEMLERIRQALMAGRRRYTRATYESLTGLETILTEDTDSLDDKRYELLNAMEELEKRDPQTAVNEAVDCHLRTMPNPDGKKDKNKKLCKLCKTSDLFEEYEQLLFRQEDVQMDNSVVENVRVFGKLNRNVWAEGETEKILKAILGYAKLRKLNESWIADGNTQLKVLDAEKKEFKHLRVYWRQLNDHISALDELNMCKLRLRVRFPHEPQMKTKPSKTKAGKQPLGNLSSNLENKVETIYIIEEHEVESYMLRLATERSTAQGEMRRRMGQLQYLQNLQRDGLGNKGGANTELCPICRKNLGEKWSVLLCGHCYCLECLNQLKYHQHNKRVVCCPVCRECTGIAEISYVNTNPDMKVTSNALEYQTLPPLPPLQEPSEVRGNYSAKAEAVVRVLKNIQSEEPDAKALVFSTWSDMLHVLEQALRHNDISCTRLEKGPKFQTALNLFKDPAKKVSALLLTVNSGANGLNLIEATHVLLVEPILNPAIELQAVGRVHRIGQNKPTYVHRFVVRGTIEERMHEVLKAYHQNKNFDEDPVTLRDLYNMFSSTPSGSAEVEQIQNQI